MKYAIILLLIISAGQAFADDVMNMCPVIMDGKQFYEAGGKLTLKSHGAVLCPVCVTQGTCGDGHVLIQSTVLSDGSQTGISVVENTYNQASQQETSTNALKEASQITYEAPMINGKPVCVKRLVRFRWVKAGR